MRNTQHRIHLLSGTGGAKTRTEITFSLPGAMERGDTAPWPQRDTGRKEDGRGGRPGEHTEEEIDGAGRLSSLPPPGEEAEPKPRAAPCERE